MNWQEARRRRAALHKGMKYADYRDAVHVQLTMLDGFDFAPQSGPMPPSATKRLRGKMARGQDIVTAGHDAGTDPDRVAAQIKERHP